LSIQQSIINENTVNIQLIVDRCVLDATSFGVPTAQHLLKTVKLTLLGLMEPR